MAKLSRKIELTFEEFIFFTRWLLAPAYFVLALSICILSYKTIEEFVQLILLLKVFDESHAILQILTIVDLILVLNLVLMVLFVGYSNFVSIIEPAKTEDIPRWIGHIDYSGLKIQLLGSVIAIATIKLLRVFLELADSPDAPQGRLVWMVVLFGGFVLAALVVAIINKLLHPHGDDEEPGFVTEQHGTIRAKNVHVKE